MGEIGFLVRGEEVQQGVLECAESAELDLQQLVEGVAGGVDQLLAVGVQRLRVRRQALLGDVDFLEQLLATVLEPSLVLLGGGEVAGGGARVVDLGEHALEGPAQHPLFLRRGRCRRCCYCRASGSGGHRVVVLPVLVRIVIGGGRVRGVRENEIVASSNLSLRVSDKLRVLVNILDMSISGSFQVIEERSEVIDLLLDVLRINFEDLAQDLRQIIGNLTR